MSEIIDVRSALQDIVKHSSNKYSRLLDVDELWINILYICFSEFHIQPSELEYLDVPTLLGLLNKYSVVNKVK